MLQAIPGHGTAPRQPCRLAHLSDLHVGRSPKDDQALMALTGSLRAEEIDLVVVSGDVTHRGLGKEWDRFRALFHAWISEERLIVVPGNHDCLGDEISRAIMPGSRVEAVRRGALYVVKVNSNGPHNRRWLNAHGWLGSDDIEAISRALDHAPTDTCVAVTLHHHLLPLPEDHPCERLMSWMGWPFTSELMLGHELVNRLRGRCDLVLHGHRHMPASLALFAEDTRPLTILNAGSSTDLGAFRCFSVNTRGRLVGTRWIEGARFARLRRSLGSLGERAASLPRAYSI